MFQDSYPKSDGPAHNIEFYCEKGSAAEKAGIQAGDVIVKLDGSSIASDTELVEGLKYYEAGEEVEIVVKTRESGYEEQTFSVVLGSRKAAGLD